MTVDNKETITEALKLHQSGSWDLAQLEYRKILDRDFYHPQANYLLGILLSQKKAYYKSTVLLERALPYQKDNADLFNALSINHQKTGDYQKALEYIDAALDLNPTSCHFHHRKSKILIDQKQIRNAIVQAQIAINLNYDFIEAYLTIAHCHQLLGRPNRAVKFLKNALKKIKNKHQKIFVNLINLHIELMQYQKAQTILNILAKNSLFTSERLGLQAVIHRELNQPNKSLDCLTGALQEDANNIIARWNLCLLYLKDKSFNNGWPLYDLGFAVRQRHLKTYKNIPTWKGEPLQQKDILIFNEQGIGDEIMFSRYYPSIYSQSALCTIICDPKLVEIFTHSHPEAEFLDYQAPINKNQTYDYVINAGSIPQYVDSSNLTTVSLNIPQQHKRQISIHKNNQRLNIGFSWKGGIDYKDKIRRSTHIRNWQALLDLPGCHFWCLQRGVTEQDKKLLNKFTMNNISYLEDNELNSDLNLVVTVIEQMDLIITVDNTIAHLSGALGMKTWCLLPFCADWRWTFNDVKSYWYNDVELIRQKAPRDWDSAIEQARNKLYQLVQAKSLEKFT